jgi:ribose-phosphate pyrophosphokinase
MKLLDPVLFAPVASRLFGERVAAALGTQLAPMEEREYEAGQHKARPLVNVRGRDVYVIQALQGEMSGGSANDRLCRLLFFIATLKDAGARHVTACVPYLAYARKDRRTKERDPVTLRYVAQLFEAVRLDRMMVIDAHNIAAFENAFRCPTDHLEAVPLFARHFAKSVDEHRITVASPDIGGSKRAQRLQELLARHTGRDIGFALLDKRRSGGVVSGDLLAGPVEGRRVVIIDDLISAGTTMVRAVEACRAAGAVSVHAVATHAVFVEGAERLLAQVGADELVITDTILPTPLSGTSLARQPVVLSASALFAEAIRRIGAGESVTELRELERPRA